MLYTASFESLIQIIIPDRQRMLSDLVITCLTTELLIEYCIL